MSTALFRNIKLGDGLTFKRLRFEVGLKCIYVTQLQSHFLMFCSEYLQSLQTDKTNSFKSHNIKLYKLILSSSFCHNFSGQLSRT